MQDLELVIELSYFEQILLPNPLDHHLLVRMIGDVSKYLTSSKDLIIEKII